jgi:MOSC domain
VLQGTVAALALDAGHHFSKSAQERVKLVAGHGVEGDAHAGSLVRHRYLARRQPRLPNLRQVHLLPDELFASLSSQGYTISPGQLGENITTHGIELECLPLGTKLAIGDTAAIQLTGLRTPCGLIDRFQAGLKRRLIFKDRDVPYRCGVMGIVTASGRITTGDRIIVIFPERLEPLPCL